MVNRKKGEAAIMKAGTQGRKIPLIVSIEASRRQVHYRSESNVRKYKVSLHIQNANDEYLDGVTIIDWNHGFTSTEKARIKKMIISTINKAQT